MKVLITSDIHINDFRAHNILGDPLFRLNQFGKLANRMVQIIDEEKVEAVCIAGDFLHIASPRPYIVNAAGRFLKTIARKCPVYVTHGQHDFDSRTTMSADNSLLSLYNNIDNVHYLHEETVELDKRKFYFQGWTPEQKFDNVNQNQYDVLIGHATINGAVMNGYGVTAVGPEFESNKFKIAFMGDIHFPGTKDNIVIPGVPLQNNFGDSADNSVIILDTNDLSWKRVKTETMEFRFLKFLTTDKEFNDPYILTNVPGSSKKLTLKENLTKSIDVMQVIDKYVKEENLSDIHEKAMVVTSKLEAEEINLNFVIEDLKIKNFRSIEKLEWTPLTGISVLFGANGSGKSSLVEAIRFGLEGTTSSKEFLRDDETEMSVEITISYANLSYTIVRGFKKAGYLKYYINGQEQTFENQKEGNRRIKKDLSFLEMYNILHRDQDTPKFLGSHSYDERVNMLSKVIGLYITERLKESVENFKAPLIKPIKSLTTELGSLKLYIENMKEMNFDEPEISYDVEISKLEETVSQLTILQSLDVKYFDLQSSLKRAEYGLIQFRDNNFEDMDVESSNLEQEVLDYNKNISDINTSIQAVSIKLDGFRNEMASKQSKMSNIKRLNTEIVSKEGKISSHICYTCNQEIDKDLTSKLVSDIQSEKDGLQEQLKEISAELPKVLSSMKSLNEEKENYEAQISEINSKKISAMTEINRRKALKSSHEKYKLVLSEVNDFKSKLADVEKKVNTTRFIIRGKYFVEIENSADTLSKISELKSTISAYREKKETQNKLKSLRDDFSKKKSKLVEVESDLSRITSEYAEYDKYINLMAFTGPIVRSVLTTISDSLTNDKIRVVAFKTLANEETRPDFNLYLNVAGKWRNYDKLSGGQKNICDVFILKHIIDLAGGAGSMVFDETFAHVDNSNLEFIVNVIKNIKVNHTFIISHHESFPYFDNQILTDLNKDTGITTYKIQ